MSVEFIRCPRCYKRMSVFLDERDVFYVGCQVKTCGSFHYVGRASGSTLLAAIDTWLKDQRSLPPPKRRRP